MTSSKYWRNLCMMIIEMIRKEIEKSKKTRYQIWQDTGVSEAQLCRLMQGKTITCETADILLKYFGYKLEKKKGR